MSRPRTKPSQRTQQREVIARLRQLQGDQTLAEFAREIHCNAETIRRYLAEGPPCLWFLMNLHRNGYSIDWLLSGQHEERLEDCPRSLENISTDQLIAELSTRKDIKVWQLTALNSRTRAVAEQFKRRRNVAPVARGVTRRRVRVRTPSTLSRRVMARRR